MVSLCLMGALRLMGYFSHLSHLSHSSHLSYLGRLYHTTPSLMLKLMARLSMFLPKRFHVLKPW